MPRSASVTPLIAETTTAGPRPSARARVPNNLNQSLNRLGIGDRGAAEFLNNHKQQILYGKAGVAAATNQDQRS